MTYKLIMAYDGTNYHGWQRQKNGITVQEVLENVLSQMFGKETVVNDTMDSQAARDIINKCRENYIEKYCK